VKRLGFTISKESLESALRIIAEKRCALQGMCPICCIDLSCTYKKKADYVSGYAYAQEGFLMPFSILINKVRSSIEISIKWL